MLLAVAAAAPGRVRHEHVGAAYGRTTRFAHPTRRRRSWRCTRPFGNAVGCVDAHEPPPSHEFHEVRLGFSATRRRCSSDDHLRVADLGRKRPCLACTGPRQSGISPGLRKFLLGRSLFGSLGRRGRRFVQGVATDGEDLGVFGDLLEDGVVARQLWLFWLSDQHFDRRRPRGQARWRGGDRGKVGSWRSGRVGGRQGQLGDAVTSDEFRW